MSYIRVAYGKACRLKVDTQKYMCYDEIEICAQNEDTILGSVVNPIRRACVIP